jgi:hypothetical protein
VITVERCAAQQAAHPQNYGKEEKESSQEEETPLRRPAPTARHPLEEKTAERSAVFSV